MDRHGRVAVVEPDDHPDRDHVLAHRVDERAAELAVARRRAKRPAHRVDHLAQRPRNLPDLLDAERPRLRARPGEAEAVERGERQMPLRPLGEDRHLRADVGARLEPRRAPRPRGRAPCRRSERRRRGRPRRAATGADGLRQDRGADLLGDLGEEAPELRDRDDDVAVVPHRRRDRKPDRAVGSSAAAPTRRAPARRSAGLRARAAPSSSRQSGSGSTTAPESRCDPGAFPFSSTATGTSPSAAGRLGIGGDQLPEPDRRREPGRAGADDEHPDLDRLGVAGRGDRLGVSSTAAGSRTASRAAALPDEVGEPRHDLVQVADDTEVGVVEDRRVRILVDRDDRPRALHPHLVLDRARDPDRDVQLRRDRLAGLTDLRRVRVPARVDDGARRGDRAAERLGEVLDEREALGPAEAAPAGDDDVGLLDRRARPARPPSPARPARRAASAARASPATSRTSAAPPVSTGSKLPERNRPSRGSRRPPHVDPDRVGERRALADQRLAVLARGRRGPS